MTQTQAEKQARTESRRNNGVLRFVVYDENYGYQESYHCASEREMETFYAGDTALATFYAGQRV